MCVLDRMRDKSASVAHFLRLAAAGAGGQGLARIEGGQRGARGIAVLRVLVQVAAALLALPFGIRPRSPLILLSWMKTTEW
ncbi:hypothetical protein GCM10027317_41720 [Massilia agri]